MEEAKFDLVWLKVFLDPDPQILYKFEVSRLNILNWNESELYRNYVVQWTSTVTGVVLSSKTVNAAFWKYILAEF